MEYAHHCFTYYLYLCRLESPDFVMWTSTDIWTDNAETVFLYRYGT
jgi:hypothetical protein